MATFAPDWALSQVVKAKNADIVRYRQGIQLEKKTGHTVQELQHRGCADRIELARSMHQAGTKLMSSRPPQFRSAISRFYYAMYHASRAVVYFANDGDDHEEHSKLPIHLPGDFPGLATWVNTIKDARVKRNDADYEPYPDTAEVFKAQAKDLRDLSADLVQDCVTYLKAKGCQYL
jgi:uncharacterized protein (UPF0332 family)